LALPRRRLYRRYTVLLRDLAHSGLTRPSFVVTHYGGLDDACGFLRTLDEFVHEAIKVVYRHED
jgi:threonine dehydrogenase-like Zn-dependent dehydrogenase